MNLYHDKKLEKKCSNVQLPSTPKVSHVRLAFQKMITLAVLQHSHDLRVERIQEYSRLMFLFPFKRQVCDIGKQQKTATCPPSLLDKFNFALLGYILCC